MFKLAVFLALAAVASANIAYSNAPAQSYKAAPAYRPKAVSYQPQQSYDAPAQYNFNWAVNDGYGSDFSQTESRNGDNTDGSYSVLLPDCRRQTVKYYVNGDSGFLAEVIYEGTPCNDNYARPAYQPAPVAYKPAPAPRVYAQPAPVVYRAAPAPRVYAQPAPAAQVYRPAPASVTYV